MAVNLHIYPAYMVNESRVFRVTNALKQTYPEMEVHVVGLHREGMLREEIQPNGVKIIRIPLREKYLIPGLKSIAFYREWFRKIIHLYKDADINIVHSNSVFDLPLAVRFKKKKPGIRIVYDAHELETERNNVDGKRKLMLRYLERRNIPFADHVFVVSKSILSWYQKKYNLTNLSLLRNVPDPSPTSRASASTIRTTLGLNEDARIFVYAGIYVEGRGLMEMIRAFLHLSHPCHLAFLGYGYLEPAMKEAARNSSHIHFLEPVPSEELVSFLRDASVGMSLIENTCLSYYYCLPNKVFEYLTAGVPAVVSDFPDMREAVDVYGAGWAIQPVEKEILSLISRIDDQEINRKKNLIDHGKIPVWENEKENLLTVYRKLLNL